MRDLNNCAEDLVLTVREDPPLRLSGDDLYSNPNTENIPEPVFFLNSGDYKMVKSDSAFVSEIKSLKSQLKIAKDSNLESKIIIEGCNNELKDKDAFINDFKSEIENLKKKLNEQEKMIEDGKRMVNSRDEHLTRFYDQKMVAFKAQVADLEEKLKIQKIDYDSECNKWKEIESEIRQRIQDAAGEVRAKETRLSKLEEENQLLNSKLNEKKRVSLYSAFIMLIFRVWKRLMLALVLYQLVSLKI